jgi:ATP-dependent Clp protease ATP-binding subunit ClpB
VRANGCANTSPRFINRVDEILVFHPLDRGADRGDRRYQLRGLQQRLAERRITLELTAAAKAY